jgi:hypothetical protein
MASTSSAAAVLPDILAALADLEALDKALSLPAPPPAGTNTQIQAMV